MSRLKICQIRKKWVLRTKGSHEIKLEDERIQMINVSDVDQRMIGLEIVLNQNHRSNNLQNRQVQDLRLYQVRREHRSRSRRGVLHRIERETKVKAKTRRKNLD